MSRNQIAQEYGKTNLGQILRFSDQANERKQPHSTAGQLIQPQFNMFVINKTHIYESVIHTIHIEFQYPTVCAKL